MSYALRDTQYAGRSTYEGRRAFTLIELVVAIALMVIVVVFAGSIFKVSIGAQRTARANAEVMQKFRAITEQLNSDFAGLRKDAPMLIWFELDPNDGARYDQIMFFANGDFSSIQVYYPVGGVYYPASVVANPSGMPAPVISNLARIYYGQANHYNYASGNLIAGYRFFDTLARRQHLLTADPDVIMFPNISTAVAFDSSFNVLDNRNDLYEHDTIALAQWQAISRDIAYNDVTIARNFRDPVYGDIVRPRIDFVNPQRLGLHTLLSQEVNNFSIQWGYEPNILGTQRLLWWPEHDTDPNSPTYGSDFQAMQVAKGLPYTAFGIYFNISGTNQVYWFRPQDAVTYVPGAPVFSFPEALKFTLTIRDSKGVFPKGQTFTHIIYLDR